MFNSFARLFIITVLFLASCKGGGTVKVSTDNGGGSGSKIISGAELEVGLSPQIVKIDITFNNQTGGFCTGTVIGASSILTSAHCFDGGNGVESVIVNKPDGTIEPVVQIFIHPQYSINPELGAIFNDVAVIKTSDPLNLPVLGILVSTQVTAPAFVDIYGFGLDQDGNSGVLKRGSMLVEIITPNHLFAVYDDLCNACNGDSGGPVVFNVVGADGALISASMVGLISSGSDSECGKGDTNLFTNLNNTSIINFITGLVPEVALQ